MRWSEAQDPVSYYLVAYGLSPGTPEYGNPNVGGKGITSYTVSGLSGGVTYYFKVRAGNGCAPGDFSNEVSASPLGVATFSNSADNFVQGVLGTKDNQVTESSEKIKGEAAKVLATSGQAKDKNSSSVNGFWESIAFPLTQIWNFFAKLKFF